ncbi:hypothetical protein K438DRAFT_1788814 [Mycena galopus ATCC 62051]|nr:hypothetical protein K438DRAFT_1788814 [Mycena galopus ATCC 62051]
MDLPDWVKGSMVEKEDRGRVEMLEGAVEIQTHSLLSELYALAKTKLGKFRASDALDKIVPILRNLRGTYSAAELPSAICRIVSGRVRCRVRLHQKGNHLQILSLVKMPGKEDDEPKEKEEKCVPLASPVPRKQNVHFSTNSDRVRAQRYEKQQKSAEVQQRKVNILSGVEPAARNNHVAGAFLAVDSCSAPGSAAGGDPAGSQYSDGIFWVVVAAAGWWDVPTGRKIPPER